MDDDVLLFIAVVLEQSLGGGPGLLVNPAWFQPNDGPNTSRGVLELEEDEMYFLPVHYPDGHWSIATIRLMHNSIAFNLYDSCDHPTRNHWVYGWLFTRVPSDLGLRFGPRVCMILSDLSVYQLRVARPPTNR